MTDMQGQSRLKPYDCVVCLMPIEVPPGGKIRIEGVVKGEEWVWGPYPVHEPCRLKIVTPYDGRLGDGEYASEALRAKTDDTGTVELLAKWAAAGDGTPARHSPGHFSRYVPPMATPWPELDPLVDLNRGRLAGIVSKRGSREAPAGKDIAIHTAVLGKRALLFTGYPPPLQRGCLIIDDTANPTPSHIDAAIRSVRPDLVVIERWERMHPDWEREGTWADQLDEIGQSLLRVLSDHGVPMLATTSVVQDIDMSGWQSCWAGIDHPASIMLEFCNPLLNVQRINPAEVHVRVERHTVQPPGTLHTVVWKS